MDLELGGKVAVVTGGSRGIGKASAWQLAREGANVALVARDRSVLESAAAEISGDTGRRVAAFPSDTGDDASVRATITDVIAAFGRIDILVNCAAQPGGQAKPPGLAELTTETLWAGVKVMGYLRTAREAAPHMKAQGHGRIINVSGLAARSTGSIIGSVRNVSVAALTKNIADEILPIRLGVRHRSSAHLTFVPGVKGELHPPPTDSRDEVARHPEAEMPERSASNEVRRTTHGFAHVQQSERMQHPGSSEKPTELGV